MLYTNWMPLIAVVLAFHLCKCSPQAVCWKAVKMLL